LPHFIQSIRQAPALRPLSLLMAFRKMTMGTK
jgi:hypothetical protein